MNTEVAKLTEENKDLQTLRIKLDSKIKTLQEHQTYIEERNAQIVRDKEDEIIKLKSDVIVYK